MHQKKAASVLPLPVGADIRVCWPAATDRQPPSWTSVGAAKAPENQARAAGENRSRTVGIGSSLPAESPPSLDHRCPTRRSQIPSPARGGGSGWGHGGG